MKSNKAIILFICFVYSAIPGISQDTVYHWQVKTKRIAAHEYQLVFSTNGNNNWQLYAPNQKLGDVLTTELQLNDSSVKTSGNFSDSSTSKVINSSVFNQQVKISETKTTWKTTIKIEGQVPSVLQGILLYSYGKGDE